PFESYRALEAQLRHEAPAPAYVRRILVDRTDDAHIELDSLERQEARMNERDDVLDRHQPSHEGDPHRMSPRRSRDRPGDARAKPVDVDPVGNDERLAGRSAVGDLPLSIRVADRDDGRGPSVGASRESA